jgi:hypothetical protein
MKTLDEFLVERRAEVEDAAKGDDAHAAMSRLMLRNDSVEVTRWIKNEQERGTPAVMIQEALSSYIAHVIAPACIPQAEPMLAAFQVVSYALQCFRCLTASTRDAVVVTPEGREVHVTVADLAKEGVPE